MSNLVPLAPYQQQSDMVRASMLELHRDVYSLRPRPTPVVVRPAPIQPDFRPAA